MKRKRFTEEEIIGILKESEAGAKNQELCREAWDQRANVLPVAVEVRWDASVGSEETPGAGGRESEAEAAVGRSPSG